AARVNDLLLPIVKGVGSERAYQYLTESLQTLGGSGFLQDYPIEQYIRDAKIDSLYEGTTAIQAQDFFFRKIARDRGVALAHVAGKIRDTAQSPTGNGRLKAEKVLLATALEDVQDMAARLTQHLLAAQEQPAELYKIGLNSVRFLLAVGDLLVAWRLIVAAEIALAALDSGAEEQDRAFYQGKVAVASFFAKTVLPHLSAEWSIISDVDTSVMELDEAAF
uniref:acyl-CoA dehydrogenase C-terminal domain-containing protein n=1 Tax=Nocardia amamiensis TaxID=404578 RepID=UPI000AC3A2BD